MLVDHRASCIGPSPWRTAFATSSSVSRTAVCSRSRPSGATPSRTRPLATAADSGVASSVQRIDRPSVPEGHGIAGRRSRRGPRAAGRRVVHQRGRTSAGGLSWPPPARAPRQRGRSHERRPTALTTRSIQRGQPRDDADGRWTRRASRCHSSERTYPGRGSARRTARCARARGSVGTGRLAPRPTLTVPRRAAGRPARSVTSWSRRRRAARPARLGDGRRLLVASALTRPRRSRRPRRR